MDNGTNGNCEICEWSALSMFGLRIPKHPVQEGWKTWKKSSPIKNPLGSF